MKRAAAECFYTVPADRGVARAHALTGRPAYLEALTRSAQFSVGSNLMNITMTTGLGHDYPRNPLHIDARSTGQLAPFGITVHGPLDLGTSNESVLPRLRRRAHMKIGEVAAKAGMQQHLHDERFEMSKVDGSLVYEVLVELLDPKLVKIQFQMSAMRVVRELPQIPP